MKLSVLFLICSLSMTYAAESYAQKTMISLEVRNETVGTVLEKLKKESGFDFFFNNKHVDLKRIVSVSANNNNADLCPACGIPVLRRRTEARHGCGLRRRSQPDAPGPVRLPGDPGRGLHRRGICGGGG